MQTQSRTVEKYLKKHNNKECSDCSQPICFCCSVFWEVKTVEKYSCRFTNHINNPLFFHKWHYSLQYDVGLHLTKLSKVIILYWIEVNEWNVDTMNIKSQTPGKQILFSFHTINRRQTLLSNNNHISDIYWTVIEFHVQNRKMLTRFTSEWTSISEVLPLIFVPGTSSCKRAIYEGHGWVQYLFITVIFLVFFSINGSRTFDQYQHNRQDQFNAILVRNFSAVQCWFLFSGLVHNLLSSRHICWAISIFMTTFIAQITKGW